MDEGIRTSKTVNGVTTTYYLSGSQIIAEETSGNLTVYIYDSNGSPIGMQYHGSSYAEDAWDVFWYEKNLQGDIVAVYSDTGTKLVTYYYDAFGYCIASYDNNGSSTIAYYNPFRYRGYYYDKDLDLYYLNARYYDGRTGRFISPDAPSYLGANGDLNSYNLYAYCSNNPVMYVDPNGNSPEWWQWTLAGIGVGLITVAAGMAILGTGGVAAFGMGALIGSSSIGFVGAGAGAAIGYAVDGEEGILGGILTGFGAGSIVGFVVGGLFGYHYYSQPIKVQNYINQYAKNSTDADEILNSFTGRIRIKTSNGRIKSYRYYDNINAFPRGRYVTNKTTKNPISDLVLYNNNATYLARWNIQKGQKFLVGKIAGSSVGAIQYFLGNSNWLIP